MGRSLALTVDPHQGFSNAGIPLATKTKRSSTGGKVGPPSSPGLVLAVALDGRMQAGHAGLAGMAGMGTLSGGAS